MGYFSELDIEHTESRTDNSYHGYEEQLLWRYEELKERYSLLSREGAPMHGDDYFSKNDYKYAPVDCYTTASDLCRALETARTDLEQGCGITVESEEDLQDSTEEDCPNQISLFEIVVFPPLMISASVA